MFLIRGFNFSENQRYPRPSSRASDYSFEFDSDDENDDEAHFQKSPQKAKTKTTTKTTTTNQKKIINQRVKCYSLCLTSMVYV